MYPHEQLDRPREITAQSEALPSSKNTHHAKHPLNAKELLESMQHAVGGGTIIGLTIATILLWFLFRPAGQPEVDPFSWSAQLWKLSKEKSVKTLKKTFMRSVNR